MFGIVNLDKYQFKIIICALLAMLIIVMIIILRWRVSIIYVFPPFCNDNYI